MDRIVIEKTVEVVPGSSDGDLPHEEERTEVRYRALIDTKLPPMSDVIKHMKEEKYKLRLDENDICNQEFSNPRALGITLNVLAEC
jgi:hypothetical protein